MELDADVLIPFAGAPLAINVGFQWDGGVPLWSGTTIFIPRPGEGPIFQPPPPRATPAPTSLHVSYGGPHDHLAVLNWDNPTSYDKILVRWGFKNDPASEVQFQRGGRATTADCRKIFPNRAYVFRVKGGRQSVFGIGGYNYSDWSSIESTSPDGPVPMPDEGIFPRLSRISAVARRPDRLQLFGAGNDGVVHTSWWHAGEAWAASTTDWRWPRLGGFFPAGAPVSVVARTPDHLDLFITGGDGRVYTAWWHEGSEWSGLNNNWRPIGGFFPAGAPVSVVARTPDHLDLFITGNNRLVYTSWWHEGSEWSGLHDNWAPIGG